MDRWKVKAGSVWKVDTVYVSGHSISDEVGVDKRWLEGRGYWKVFLTVS